MPRKLRPSHSNRPLRCIYLLLRFCGYCTLYFGIDTAPEHIPEDGGFDHDPILVMCRSQYLSLTYPPRTAVTPFRSCLVALSEGFSFLQNSLLVPDVTGKERSPPLYEIIVSVWLGTPRSAVTPSRG